MSASVNSIAPMLIRTNLQLSEQDFANSEIRVRVNGPTKHSQYSLPRFRFLFEQESDQTTIWVKAVYV